ncbi:MAG: PKD domain-containing protein [Bacteroidales bacterium]|nr:PKD domain-containing protein [Bacteroidales bacterium]
MQKIIYILISTLIITSVKSSIVLAQNINFQGLNLWLRADSLVFHNSNYVYEWKDISGNNFHLTQSNSLYQPTFVPQIDSLNHLPAILFNNSYILNNQSITIGTFYIVCNYNANTFQDYCGLITQASVSDGNTDYLIVSSPGNTNFYHSILNQNLYINQNQTYNFAPLRRPKIIKGILNTPVSWNSLMIGYDRSLFTRFWNGYVFEIIIYDRTLSISEQLMVEQYIMNKYAPSVNLPNDTILTTLCPIVVKPQGYYTSYQWSTGQTSDSIVIEQSGTYYITATDIFGRQSIDSIKISFPFPNFESNRFLCPNDSIIIDTQLSETLFSFLWNDSSSQSFITVHTPGSFWVTITDSTNCIYQSDTINVSLDSFANENLLSDTVYLCRGDTLSLLTNSAIKYYWNTGDSTSFIVPLNTGSYKITAYNSNQCQNIDSCFIVIKGQKPSPQILKNNSCVNTIQSYTGNSTGNIIQWTWTFHDTIINGQIVNYSYHQPGIYSVSLYVKDTNTCHSVVSIIDTVFNTPRSSFSIIKGCNPNEFVLLSKVNHTIPIHDYIWNINGQTYYNDSLITIISNNASVSLTTVDIKGCRDTVVQIVNQNISNEVIPAQIIYPKQNQNIFKNTFFFHWNNYSQLSLLELSFNNNFNPIILRTPKSITNSYFINNLIKNRIYYGRVWTYNACHDSVATNFQFNTFLPDSIDGLTIWLRSDSEVVVNSQNKIIQWKDVSGNQHHFDTLSLAQAPYYVANIDSIGQLPSIVFNNGALVLNNTTNIGTLFIVANYKFQSFQNFSGLLTRKEVVDGNSDFFIISSASGTNLYQSILNQQMYINNQSTYNFAPLQRPKIIKGILNNPVLWGDLLIGLDRNIAGRYWQGNVWEFLSFNKALTLNEQNLIETYLMDKYAPPVSLPADTVLTSFCPFTIKPKGYFTSYLWNTNDTSDSITVTKSGKYIITATDIFGRISKDSMIVTFPQTNIPDTIVICYGDSSLVTSALGNLVDYYWSTGSKKNYSYVKQHGWHYVTITDLTACSSIDSFFVKVDSLSIIPLFINDTLNLCSGNILSIQQTIPNITHYFWKPTLDTTSTIVVNQSQYYSVEIENKYGCRNKDSVYVNIKGIAPIAQFTASHTCLGDTTILVSTSYSIDTSAIIHWQWIINQHDTILGQQTPFIFTNYGNQLIKLIVQTQNGCSQFVEDTILVHPLPNVNFNVSGFCQLQQTNFFSSASLPWGQVVDYYWNFGDGHTSIDQNPSHIYDQPGNYTVSFTAISNEGCAKTISKQIDIKYTPHAGFYYGASCAQSPTYFTDTSRTLSYFPIIQWKWDFGNGTISTLQNPTCIYQQAGNYMATLTIKIANGCTDSISKQITVTSSPQAMFTHDSACVHQPLQITDASTIQNSQITKWNWYVNNQYFSSNQNIVLYPQQTGNISVLLIVESQTHCLDTFYKTIQIKPKPTVNFTANPNYGPAPLFVEFNNQSENGQSYWNFGDNTYSHITHPTHIFNDTGTYSVWLKLINNNGCYDSISKIILVVPNISDLSIDDIQILWQQPYIIVLANIANTGTLPIENPELQLWTNGRFLVSEILYDTLFSGDKIWYTFNGKINTNYIEPRFVCITGNITQPTSEVNYQNNTYCKSISDEEQILNIYPNPVKDKLIIELQSSDNQPMSLIISDITGKILLAKDIFLNKNFNRIQIDVSELSEGIYFIQLTSKKLNFVYKFLRY